MCFDLFEIEELERHPAGRAVLAILETGFERCKLASVLSGKASASNPNKGEEEGMRVISEFRRSTASPKNKSAN